MTRVVQGILALLLFLGFALPALADDASEQVREGIRQFRGGDLESAKKAFAEADLSRPDNLFITFDLACAYDAQGDRDKAVELFQKASLSREGDLAAMARFNLGCLAATKARELFGEKPEDATPEIREEGVQHLLRAVMHYRDSIELKRDYEDARYNVELIRLWIKHMTALWKEKDKQKAREEMDLFQFLEMIENRQSALRSLLKAIAREKDSPKRRQVLSEAEAEQRELMEEIDPLKEKVEQTVAGPTQAQGPGPMQGQGQGDPEKQKEALEVLKSWADETYDFMGQAADLIIGTPEDTYSLQTQALDGLNRIFGAVAPFPRILNKALQRQQGLVEGTIPLVESAEEMENVDYETMSWAQDQVAGWSEIMVPKAEEGLKALQAMGDQVPQGADPEEAKKQKEGLIKSMEKAIELCPQVSNLTRGAAEALKDEDPSTALPNEEEALKLLKEIAKDMPKDPEQQGDQDSEDKKQEGQDEKKQDPSSQKDQKEQQQKQQRELSQREAEALLQKAKEREREHKEKMEELRRALGRPGKVEKDW